MTHPRSQPQQVVLAPQPRRAKRLPSIASSLGIAGGLLAAPLLIATGAARPLDSLVAAGMVLVAIAYASTSPRALPTIVVGYLVFNRFVRRLLDYSANEFSIIPPTSLVTPVLCLLMGIAVLSRWRTMPASLRRGSKLYLQALAYGAVVGVAWGPGMVFELIKWLAPFGFGLYVAWLRPTQHELGKMVTVFAVLVSVGAGYGWIQWLFLPPWDEFWIRNCGMGSIGHPEPMRCRIFGTFGSHGALAGLSAVTGALLLITPRVASGLRLGLSAVLGLAVLMSGVRSALLSAVAIIMASGVKKRGRGMKTLVPLAVIAVVIATALPSLPGSDFAYKRLNSLGNINADSSLRGRAEFSVWAIKQIAGRPYGFGLGSTGLGATRLGAGDLAAFDSGYLQPLYALGLPGALLLFLGLRTLLKPILVAGSGLAGVPGSLLTNTQAIVLGTAVSMIVSNPLNTDGACFFWMFVLTTHTQLVEGGARQSVRSSQPPPALRS